MSQKSHYDYENQAWYDVASGKYDGCGHPVDMNCGCYGREHEGETVPKAIRDRYDDPE